MARVCAWMERRARPSRPNAYGAALHGDAEHVCMALAAVLTDGAARVECVRAACYPVSLAKRTDRVRVPHAARMMMRSVRFACAGTPRTAARRDAPESAACAERRARWPLRGRVRSRAGRIL
eukprot:4508208-Prymnesium_polylepis.1